MAETDSLLNDKELDRARKDALTNPLMKKLLSHYLLDETDIELGLRNAMLMYAKDLTTDINNRTVSLDNPNTKAMLEILCKFDKICNSLTLANKLAHGNAPEENEITGHDMLSQARRNSDVT